MSLPALDVEAEDWHAWPPERKAALIERLKKQQGAGAAEAELLRNLWTPSEGRQAQALESPADELYYGGAAGGGKSDLLLGCAITQHRTSIIYRRQYKQFVGQGLEWRSQQIIGKRVGTYNSTDMVWRLPDERSLEFGAIQHETDVENFQGRPHSFCGFDEIQHFSEFSYYYLMAWLRSSIPGERLRVICTGNPPRPGQPGAVWLIKNWAPWLDPKYPTPAEYGELRWYARIDEDIEWMPPGVTTPFPKIGADGEPVMDPYGEPEMVIPKSRTFIPARVEDNPYLWKNNPAYVANLNNLPPLERAALRYGDYGLVASDDPRQVIPTLWILAAMERWRKLRANPDFNPRQCGPLQAVSCDPARGGPAKTVICKRYGNYYAPLIKWPGKETPDGGSAALKILQAFDAGEWCTIYIDPLNVGYSVLDILTEGGYQPRPVNFAGAAVDDSGNKLTDRTGRYHFRNWRSYCYWKLMEMLDPESGEDLALPDDQELLNDLAAQRYTMTTQGITLDRKELISEALGHSPDAGDAVAIQSVSMGGLNPLAGIIAFRACSGWSPS